jgi:hypothetical protein
MNVKLSCRDKPGNRKVQGVNEWDGLNAQFVTTLREQKVEPVPEPIIKLAQRSLDGIPHPTDEGVVLHAMQLEFETEARAAAFARHMRNAGLHTSPASSITVVIDPERRKVPKTEDGREVVNETGRPVMVPGPAVNPRLVAWRAGARRGRNSGS